MEVFIQEINMLSFFFNPCSSNRIASESETVKQFLQTSYHFQELKKSAVRSGQNNLNQIINNLERAESFSSVKTILDHYDVDHAEDVVVQTMGRNKLSVFMWFYGCVNEAANFTYHGIELLRNIQSAHNNYNQARGSMALL